MTDSVSTPSSSSNSVQSRVRWAVLCTLAGLTCVLLFLLFGFEPWSVGIGVFLGFPLLLGGIGLYLAGVVHDLRRRQAL